MEIKKLTWAGLQVLEGEHSVLIDPIDEHNPLLASMGVPREPWVPLASLPHVSAILITHLHSDHFDPSSILAVFGPDIPVLVPIESLKYAQRSALQNVVGISLGESRTFGTLTVTAANSVDGFGFPQVAWVVGGETGRILHSGDTLWHGYWWKIAKYYGPFDAACLPVNGAVVDLEGLEPRSLEAAAMTPEQAVEAAHLLRARCLVPIHYGTFHHPPTYIEAPDVLERVRHRAEQREVAVTILAGGETLAIGRDSSLT